MIEQQGDRLVVSGPMTMGEAPRLRQAGLAVLAKGSACIDLSGVEAVDSSALAVLLAWQRAGRRLPIEGAPASLRSLATLYRLDELLDSPA
ncbi:MAG: STAS domain-containing protein [Rhodocyclaceae bacterium]|nr:STAS domain-containing protein [Rhodocyclaceae bacterium]